MSALVLATLDIAADVKRRFRHRNRPKLHLLTTLADISNTLLAVLAASLVALAGCSKSDKALAGANAEVQAIDASKLRPAFASASPEAQASVDKAMGGIQSSDLTGALMELDKLANAAGTTEAQKKVVTGLMEQLKKKIASIAAAPQ